MTYGLVFAMFGAYKREKMNEMRDHSNCGTNTLCAYKHEWHLRAMAGFLENAKMNEDTQKLWIELDGSEDDGMFYLASPCKADLTVRASDCECNKFYDTPARYSEVVVHEWDIGPQACPFNPLALCIMYKIVNTHNIPIDFPVDSGYDYKGPVINFDYFPECEEGKEDTSECKMRNVDLSSGTVMDSPLMLDQALRTMDQEQLEEWVLKNTNPSIRLSGTTNTLQFAQVMPINYDQGTVYKKCIKGAACILRDISRCVGCRGMGACRNHGRGQVAWRDKPMTFQCLQAFSRWMHISFGSGEPLNICSVSLRTGNLW